MPNSPAARRIKDAYLELLAERQSNRITVTEVARRARVNRVTFYRLFETLEDVLLDVLDDFDSENRQFMDQVRPGSPGIDELSRAMLDLHRANMPMLRTVLRSDMAPVLTRRIEEGIHGPMAMGLPSGNHMDDMFLSFYVAGAARVMCDWILDGCSTDTDEIVQFFAQTSRLLATWP